MEKLKQLLGRWPFFYSAIRKLYVPLAVRIISIRGYLERNHLSARWAKGRFHSNTFDDSRKWDSIDHPHRSLLVERAESFSPVSSILEIGCSTGVNLYLLAGKFPQADIRGVDIDAEAIRAGNRWFDAEGINNVKLSSGRVEKLGEFPDKSYDIVISDAMLIYVNRDEIIDVIKEMIRVAGRGLILFERYDFREPPVEKSIGGIFKNGLWLRNYHELFKCFLPDGNIRITRVTRDIWPDEGWIKNGALIEVMLG